MRRHDVEAVHAELAAAFATREYPGDDAIAHTLGGDFRYEGDEAREWLLGKMREEVLADGIDAEHQNHPQFLTYKAWFYYFPAFAILALNLDASDLAKTLLHHLKDEAEEISFRVSLQERRAIVRWLKALADTWEQRDDRENPAQEALDCYWARSLNEELDTAGAVESQMECDTKRLRAELAAAFSGREYPGDDKIAASACDEGFEALTWLRGKTWKAVLAEGMGLEHRDLVSFITPEAWLYYFPAFATFGLDSDHVAEMDETLPLKLAWWPQTLKPFVRPAERRAIAHMLAYWADSWDRRPGGENVARYALETHWSQALDDETVRDDAPPSHDPKVLQSEIQATFAAREYPGDDRLADATYGKKTATEVGNWLRGKAWREVLAETETQGHLLTSLSPEAWLYYFPAFASLALEPEQPGRLENALFVKLTWFPQELEPFLKPAERRAIIHFLEYWANEYQHGRFDSDLPRYALTTHWKKVVDQPAEEPAMGVTEETDDVLS